MDFSIHSGENERQYIWRVSQYVSEGKITWRELADIINEKWRDSEEDYRDESAYRKSVASARAYYEDVFSKMIGSQYSDEIKEQKRELEEAKIQFRDERNEWNKQNRLSARANQKLDYLEEQLKDIGNANFHIHETRHEKNDNDMLVMLSDLHIGQTFNSSFGKFNSDIAKDRLNQYLDEIIKIQKRHRSENVYVSLLGDNISNSIHQSLAVTNRENVIDQIKLAIEYITSFCYELTKHFSTVYFTDCSGNHSRITTNKENAIHDERLDNLIAWCVGNALSHIDNFHALKNQYDIGISSMTIRGKEYIGVHGDFDGLNKSSVSNLMLMLGHIPYAITMGHRHYAAFDDSCGVKMIQGGSLAGSGDDYCIEKRLNGKPSQTVCVCNNEGIECIYPIILK